MNSIIRPVVLGTVSLTGITGHTFTLLMLRQLQNMLNKTLDSTTQRLMVSQAWCDLVLCFFALPLAIWNKAVGNSWPFTLPGVCYYRRVIQFGLSHVSGHHMTVMAVLRCAAVFVPILHARMLNKRGASAVIVAAPWLMDHLTTVSGLAFSFYRCRYNTYTGVCDVVPVEASKESLIKMKKFFLVDGIWNTFLPIVSCVLYAAVLCKLYVRKRTLVGYSSSSRGLGVTNGGTATALAVIPATSAPAATSQQIPIAQNKPTASSFSRRFNAVKIVAFACFITMGMLLPGIVLFMIGIRFYIDAEYPIVSLLLDVVYFGAYCVTPFVYAASSRDMRAVYKQLLARILCWQTKTTVQQQKTMFAVQP